MSTRLPSNNASATLFGKTRRIVLSLLFMHADESFYLRQIARSAGAGIGAVQRELKSLLEAGIIKRIARGRQAYYQANAECPVFAELKSLIIKTSGMADVVKAALAPLADRISVAFIYGSIVRSAEKSDSDVDVFIVGTVTLREIVASLQGAQKTLAREINPTIYSPKELRSKVAASNHFVKSVLQCPMIFLMGSKSELGRLAKKRVAD